MISRPDLINMEVVAQQTNRENLEQAFEIAESLGVTRLLDAEGETGKIPDFLISFSCFSSSLFPGLILVGC